MATQLRARHRTADAPPALDLPRARAELTLLLEAGADGAALLRPLRRWLVGARAAIRARFEADNDAEAAVRDHCGLIDALNRAPYLLVLDDFDEWLDRDLRVKDRRVGEVLRDAVAEQQRAGRDEGGQ